MNKQSLGLIETWGYVAALEAADAGTKAANVELIGYQITKVALVTIKFGGDVAAVKTAVTAASAAAKKVGTVVATLVIPRPDHQLQAIVGANTPPSEGVATPHLDLTGESTSEQTAFPEAPSVKPDDETPDLPVAAARSDSPASGSPSDSAAQTEEEAPPEKAEASTPSSEPAAELFIQSEVPAPASAKKTGSSLMDSVDSLVKQTTDNPGKSELPAPVSTPDAQPPPVKSTLEEQPATDVKTEEIDVKLPPKKAAKTKLKKKPADEAGGKAEKFKKKSTVKKK